jgi:hypothetical protein
MKGIPYKPIIVHASVITLFLSLCSCVPLLVGAAAGYVAHEEGFMKAPPLEDDYSARGSNEEAYEETVY